MFKEGTILVAKKDHHFIYGWNGNETGVTLQAGKEYILKKCIPKFMFVMFVIQVDKIEVLFTENEVKEYFYEKPEKVVTTQTTTTKVKALNEIDTALENYASYKVKEALNLQLERLKSWKNELISQKCSNETIVIISNIINEFENEIKNYERK